MSLSFANPWFLLGILGIAIPIYLHLYFRKHPLRKDFPSLRLIKLSVEYVARKQKMRNIILLILRICLILCLVLALSKPFIGQGAGATTGSDAPAAFVILLDNSMSMGCTSQGISMFNSAKGRALEILDHMGPNDKATIGFMNDPGDMAFSQLTWDADGLKEAVSEAPLSMSGTNVYNSFFSALKLLTNLKAYQRSIYVITDMTESAWKPFLDKYDLNKVDEGINLVLVPVGQAVPGNLSISALETESNLLIKGRNNGFIVRVANHDNRVRKTKLSLLIDGTKKLEKDLELEPESVKEIKLSYKFTKTGIVQVKAALPSDSLTYDDERFLSLKVLEPQKILLIKPEAGSDNKGSKEDLFLRFALNPLNKSKDNNFDVESRSSNELNGINPDNYSAVCLINQRELPQPFIKKLSEYLISGGNVITFLGVMVQPEWYNRNLIDNLGGGYILPARIYKRVGNAVSKSIAYQITDLDMGHPAFKIFSEDGNGDPGRAQIYEFFQTKPNPASLILCRMSHGLPGIIEEKRGMGRSMLVSFSADTSWTSWPIKPTFLPFIHQALISMVTGNDLRIGSIKPGTPISMSLNGKNIEKIFVTLPDNKKMELPLKSENSGIVHFSTRETQQSGFYKIDLIGKKSQTAGFAVNPPPEESKLKRLSIRSIPRFITLTHKPGARKTVGDKVNFLRNGFEMGRHLLWLLLLLALAETIFANIKPQKKVDH